MNRKMLPVGIETFSEIVGADYYYVDKTKMIEELLTNLAKVTLFTRPRRFGKSLNMSMLRSFFEIGTDKTIFENLYIYGNRELCDRYMGRYPVISISLKGVEAENYNTACEMFSRLILNEAMRFSILKDSDVLDAEDKRQYMDLITGTLNIPNLVYSILTLSRLLHKHYGEQVVVLIDEYDVPLAKANDRGYYDEMVLLLRNMLGNVLKTNDSLKFAVLTGCLRIAKESIFTGLNNFKVYSITSSQFDSCFGFTDEEVENMLEYYGLNDDYETVRNWYDGYRFGNAAVYCPWDVVNYCSDHIDNPGLYPENYWSNTSGNDVLRRFIEDAENQETLKMELTSLVNGHTVQKQISQELTYKELYSSIDNIWSTLLMTGYLTQRGRIDSKTYELAVPNLEIRDIITTHVLSLFKDSVGEDGAMLESFCDALISVDASKVEDLFTRYMKKTISVRDTFVRKTYRENFYHGMLLGILGYKDGWVVASNKESGDGYCDIMVQVADEDTGIVIEVKYADDENLDGECAKALAQIDDKGYAESFYHGEVKRIIKYGIACFRKQCRVAVAVENV